MTEQQISAVNQLIHANEYSMLSRLLSDVPGALAILISDLTPETKRQKLLQLLEEGAQR